MSRRIRFCICNETFQGWKWDRTCEAIALLGYDAIELAPFTITPDVRLADSGMRTSVRETARAAGLEVVGLHWLLVSPDGLSITSNDPATRASTADYLAALVDFCSDVGGSVMVLGSPSQRRLPAGETEATVLNRLEEVLRPALRRAHEQKVTICLEPLPPPEADFILTLEQAAAAIRSIGHPSLKTILDVKSAAGDKAPAEDLIREYSHLIAHVHANDSNLGYPGSGDTDFVPILNALDEVGYRGAVSIEVFNYMPDPITIAREGLAYLKSCLQIVKRKRCGADSP
ncbi:MAG TPA: sugar phosphate isomerase/epimerase family protein [Chthonomonadales bacterium]|nr:sugar phosphate isomerase/epimerase family protein [Chthonomonadales bacterium]